MLAVSVATWSLSLFCLLTSFFILLNIKITFRGCTNNIPIISEVKMRNNTLDLMKLIACFFVVTLHVGYYEELPVFISEALRFSARWAVPFFFICTGYFLGKSYKLNITGRVKKLTTIFIVSTILFSILSILKKHNELLLSVHNIFSFELFYGIYFHLWFIPSLIIGVIAVTALSDIQSKFLSFGFLLLFITTIWLADVLSCMGWKVEFSFFRELMSVPMVYIGYVIGKKELTIYTKKTLLVLLIIFFLLMICEVAVFHFLFKVSVMKRQFPLTCSLLAVIILLMSEKYVIDENPLSKLGKELSLGIYLYHPVFLPIASFILTQAKIKTSTLMLLMTFLLTSVFLYLASKICPKAFLLLNGTLRK
jgi:surface polysaccharide O-acyltransferase-like enzyme